MTRPGLPKVFPSNTPIEVFSPAMITAVSDKTMTSDELIGAARGRRVRIAPSKHLQISPGSVTTVLLPVPLKRIGCVQLHDGIDVRICECLGPFLQHLKGF